eukprot:403373623
MSSNSSPKNMQSKQSLKEIDGFNSELLKLRDIKADKSQIQDFVNNKIDKKFKEGQDYEQSKSQKRRHRGGDQSEQAVESYYICITMIKKVLESKIFNQGQKDHEYVQKLMQKYDIPCSLRMCALLYDVGEFDQVSQLSKRVLMIDSKNQEVKRFQDKVEKAKQESDEWNKLQSARDMDQFLKEYVDTQESARSNSKRNTSVAQNRKLKNDRDNQDDDVEEEYEQDEDEKLKNPARSVPQAIELLIRIVLLIPYVVFLKIIEPVITYIYHNYIQSVYISLTQRYPITQRFFKWIFTLINWASKLGIWVIDRKSGRNHKQKKQADRNYLLFEKISDDIERFKEIFKREMSKNNPEKQEQAQKAK